VEKLHAGGLVGWLGAGQEFQMASQALEVGPLDFALEGGAAFQGDEGAEAQLYLPLAAGAAGSQEERVQGFAQLAFEADLHLSEAALF